MVAGEFGKEPRKSTKIRGAGQGKGGSCSGSDQTKVEIWKLSKKQGGKQEAKKGGGEMVNTK